MLFLLQIFKFVSVLVCQGPCAGFRSFSELANYMTGHLRPLKWRQVAAFLNFNYCAFCNLNGTSCSSVRDGFFCRYGCCFELIRNLVFENLVVIPQIIVWVSCFGFISPRPPVPPPRQLCPLLCLPPCPVFPSVPIS